jgi:hypothetical protein
MSSVGTCSFDFPLGCLRIVPRIKASPIDGMLTENTRSREVMRKRDIDRPISNHCKVDSAAALDFLSHFDCQLRLRACPQPRPDLDASSLSYLDIAPSIPTLFNYLDVDRNRPLFGRFKTRQPTPQNHASVHTRYLPLLGPR